MVTETSFCEKTKKRKHGMGSKRPKYAELESDEEDEDVSANECELKA